VLAGAGVLFFTAHFFESRMRSEGIFSRLVIGVHRIFAIFPRVFGFGGSLAFAV
jgi:hypothetical protein